MRFFLILSIIAVVAVISGFFIISHFSSAEQDEVVPLAIQPLVLAVEDLSSAGFTDIQPVPLRVADLAPNSYFRVSETVINSNPEWNAAADLVAVMIRPIADSRWQYNRGQMDIKEYAGRTQARLSRPGYYISVTGPDFTKVTALAQWLSVK